MIIIDSIQTEIINTIKLLIYKENRGLLEKIDFDNDRLFLEPLLFSYFNYKSEALLPSELLTEIMQGYFVTQQEIIISHSFKNSNVAYLPKLGYFKKGQKTPFDEIAIIEKTNIEILKYPVNLLHNIFRDFSGKLIPTTEIICDIELVKKNITYLTNALSLIKENSSDHFRLIELCCQKIFLFKTDTNRTNSFAAINAHGIVFLNVYQDDYDEVFFVDDIAHQTGHIILSTLFFNRKAIFKIDEEQNVEDIIKLKDHRTIYILFHALYTYFTTFLCLDNCLKNDRFKERQMKEAIGRIGFYLKKCTSDLDRFKKINIFYQGIENVLTSDGMETYNLIEEKYMELFQKWGAVTNVFDYSNQTYNFAFKNFNELN